MARFKKWKRKGPAEGCGKIGGDAKGGGKDNANVLQVRNIHKTSRALAMECAQWSCPADPRQQRMLTWIVYGTNTAKAHGWKTVGGDMETLEGICALCRAVKLEQKEDPLSELVPRCDQH